MPARRSLPVRQAGVAKEGENMRMCEYANASPAEILMLAGFARRNFNVGRLRPSCLLLADKYD
jgi:hypothetical protein